jgi:hypothetical protein
MSEVAYCGSSEPHAEHEVGGVGRMGTFTTTCEGIPARERTAAEVVAALSDAVVFPRFLGVDDAGDNVWELENGRWTWGDEPYDAICRARTFEPERYVDKYGEPTPITKPGGES